MWYSQKQVLLNQYRPKHEYPIAELRRIKVVPYMVNVQDEIEAAALDQMYERMYELQLAEVRS